MSTDARIPTGQPPAAAGTDTPAPAAARENPQSLIQESIKYRRRAQEAERRVETLEAEILALREGRDDRAGVMETELAEARAEAERLSARLDAVERDRRLERELLQAGCTDTETALALARVRLAGAESPPDDLASFARQLLDEKPHLRSGVAATAARPALPPPSAAPKAAGALGGPQRAADRLAERARQSGSPADVMEYMRARRARGT